jgi:hypothetical protein
MAPSGWPRRRCGPALRDDGAAAGEAVQAVSDQYGGDGITGMLCAWSDWLEAVHPAAAKMRAGGARPGWTNEDAVIRTAGDMDPAPRWAGQFAMARMRMDHEMCSALIAAIPAGKVPEYVIALLVSVAETMKAIGDGRLAAAARRAGEDGR